MDAETYILGHSHKVPRTMVGNTFLQGFKYVASAEGYWIYDRIFLQLEYCNNILTFWLHEKYSLY